MELMPIKKRKRIYQDIIQQIKSAIEEGKINPGEKLPSERMLAESLCVSRTSVKEALTVLESTGVITVRPGVGIFLTTDSSIELADKLSQIIDNRQSDFKDLSELRQAIEGDAAYYAASRITDSQKENLTAIFNTLVNSEEKTNVAIEEDYQFHFAIVKASNNPMMIEVMNLVADKIIRVLKESRENSTNDYLLNHAVVTEHRNLYRAIMDSDPEKARKAMWEHHQGIKQRHIERDQNV